MMHMCGEDFHNCATIGCSMCIYIYIYIYIYEEHVLHYSVVMGDVGNLNPIRY